MFDSLSEFQRQLGHDCLAALFTSLMHMNYSQANSAMLMSTLVFSRVVRCLFIKQIVDPFLAAAGGRRGTEGVRSVAARLVSPRGLRKNTDEISLLVVTNLTHQWRLMIVKSGEPHMPLINGKITLVTLYFSITV